MKSIFFILMTVCFVFMFSSISQAIDDTLVLYFQMDAGQGDTVKDSSIYGNNGAIHGAKWTDGRYGFGLDFDGTADVEVPDAKILQLTEQASIAVWIKVKASQEGWGRIVDKSVWPDTGYDLALNADTKVIQWEAFVNGKTYSATGKIKLNDDKWHHVVVTFDNTKKELKGYVDGVIDTTGPLAGQLAGDGTPFNPNTAPLHLGLYSGGDHHFIGTMDEVAIFNRAISESEIEGLMQSEISNVSPIGSLTTTWGTVKQSQ